MEASNEEAKNPLGLSLDFMFGRGYLWAQRQRLSDWIALESLRMEIPDLKFPFDARTGLDRFRHTRCLVRDVEFAISEVGLGDLLAEAAEHLEGFEELQVRFLEDAAHISLKLSAFGANTYLSFRAALIPPEPARADEVHLSLYDYRAFGPLPYPARLVAHELLTSLLNTPVLRASGRGKSFTIGIAGDILSFRPLKLLFLHIFPRVGWKLPDLSGVVLESAQIRPGVMTIRAVDVDPKRRGQPEVVSHHLATSVEGARALAAYEAKELFSHADQALFAGEIRQALSLLASYRDIYGLHPELVARLLDCLTADPSPSNLAEAESIRRELVSEDPQDLHAALIKPLVAMARRREEEVTAAFAELSEQLQNRRQTRDWILCELALADRLSQEDPEQAARRIKEVLKRDPRNRSALERLKSLYERLGERAGLEETLKRLTGVYTDRETLKATYLQLARHLMDREGELAEARMYLEKVLRLDPTELEALHTLGESYVLSGEPLRALKAFGSAARAAEASGAAVQASLLHFRVGRLWYEELEDARQALLSFRRSLSLSSDADRDKLEPLQRVGQLRKAAEMCEKLERFEEATEYWSESVPLLERFREEPAGFEQGYEALAEEQRERGQRELLDAHRHLGMLYEKRERWAQGASHFRQILRLDPGDEQALGWLEDYLRQAGQPEELIELYTDLMEAADDERKRLDLLERLAELYASMGLLEDAQQTLRRALEIDPGRSEVRQRLVALLSEHRRYETLRDALNSVLVRTRDRDDRFEICVEIGRANQALGDKERAVRSYLEAVKLKPTELDALTGACAILESLVDERGAAAPAPVGTHTTGRLLENLLIRLAEVAPTPGQEREALLKVAMLAAERGDQAAAAEARERAKEIEKSTADSDFVDVDARLDAMLDELTDFRFGDGVDGDDGALVGEDEEEGLEEETDTTAFQDQSLRKTEEISPSPKNLDSFRRRFQSMLKKPAQLPKPESLEEASPLARILGRSPTRRLALFEDEQSEEREEREEPKTMLMPVLSAEELRQLSESEEVDEAENGQEKSGFQRGEKGEGKTAPGMHPVQEAFKSLERVRSQGEPEEVVRVIEQILSLAEDTESETLDEDQWKSLRREAGELYYYELEDGEKALPHLEALRELDPEGAGSETAVVNALEAIYEESGEVEARIRLLEERLRGAQSREMATTYRLLLAQLIWEEKQDEKAAARWLHEVLSEEKDHEAAHRLLADMARERGAFVEAAEHLEVVVRVAGGGIDAVESQRELAELYLKQLDAPEKARHHFEEVLKAAPGDSMALEGIKESQASAADWSGYVESLGRELGLLIGRPAGLSAEEMVGLESASVPAALRVSASQIVADAAHIVEEELVEKELARKLWGVTFQLWPEHVEALERRIALNREVQNSRDLAEDLEAMAAMLLDFTARFEALVEAAALRAHVLRDNDGARALYAEAIALVQDQAEPPAGIDAARRALKRLQHDE